MGNGLVKIKNDDLKLHSFAGQIKKCKVVDVYDGDTCTIVFKNKGSYEKYRFRLYGIDTPEMKPLLSIEEKEREREKQLANKAKKALSDLILNKIVRIEFTKEEKYGRLMGTIFLGKINVNYKMIDDKFAVSYDGGKKINWSNF
jgi:endonuclease YncB( thermonuclease family)